MKRDSEPTEIRKKDLRTAVVLIAACALLSAFLYIFWVRSAAAAVKEVVRRAQKVQVEIDKCMVARAKLKGLAARIDAKRKEVEECEVQFVSGEGLSDLSGQISERALACSVGISDIRKNGPAPVGGGFLEVRYSMEVTGTYAGIVSFIQYFEGWKSPEAQ